MNDSATGLSDTLSSVFIRLFNSAIGRQEFFMRFHQFIAVGCLSFFSLASHAEILTGLYQVREPVTSQTPEERTQATQKAV